MSGVGWSNCSLFAKLELTRSLICSPRSCGGAWEGGDLKGKIGDSSIIIIVYLLM